MDPIGEAIARGFGGYIRWALVLLAFISLLVAVGIGVPLWIFPAKFFGWPIWLSALPELGLALFIAGFALWTSMAEGRQPFRKARKAGAGA